MRIRTPLIATVLLVSALVAASCGGSSSNSSQSGNAPKPNAPEVSPAGDIPDNQAFVRFSPSGGGYSLKVPEGWARSSTGGATTFTDKLNSISVQATTAQAAPTVNGVQQSEIPKLAQSVKGFRNAQAGTVTRPAGKAIRITYLAAAPANSVTGKAGTNALERYLFFNKGKELVVTLSGPKGADNVDPWKIVTDSVRWSA
jgi:hypothetical protein